MEDNLTEEDGNVWPTEYRCLKVPNLIFAGVAIFVDIARMTKRRLRSLWVIL